MDTTVRSNIKIGTKVMVVQKQDQRSGKLTEGIVMRILTNSMNHPRGIKVMLEGGIVGRVQSICENVTPDKKGN
ncbi:MAG TPA: YwbE family protein [Clostridiales bacterium]|nr:YwbE family protein [Clostridiales bacterium]